MSTAVKPASSKQLEYIRRLKEQNGEPGNDTDNNMSSYEASKIIGELIARQNGGLKINEARLGMAMKECFRLSTGLGRDIWNDKRKSFIELTIRTYNLFTEIAERLQQNAAT
jgi:hypothetical protein